VDSAKATTNLWGERWSKLVLNGMVNGVSSATGLTAAAVNQNPAVRRFSTQLAGEAVRVGQALGYELEKIGRFEPEELARATEGDAAALERIEAELTRQAKPNPRDDIRRPSMAQDVMKGRRTEIEFINGYIAQKGAEIGVPAPTHSRITEIVTAIERPPPSVIALQIALQVAMLIAIQLAILLLWRSWSHGSTMGCWLPLTT
jgi:2-dehydropantoate 2-reductase